MGIHGRLLTSLSDFRHDVLRKTGHDHLYRQFDEILSELIIYSQDNNLLCNVLGESVLETIELLLKEGNVGRRPWISSWEAYFLKCTENARNLAVLVSRFDDYDNYLSNRSVSYSGLMLSYWTGKNTADIQSRSSDLYLRQTCEHWMGHFNRISRLHSEILAILSNPQVGIEYEHELLENPDDDFFRGVLMGYARTGKAHELLKTFSADDEKWVRDLSDELLKRYYP